MLKSKKGITLITLIITIVVLLILAGVSINILLGENGIITKTQSAVNQYKNAEEQQNTSINDAENYIDQMIAKNNGVISYRDLVSQTPGNATKNDIKSGKTAWVNGEQVTGIAKIVYYLGEGSSFDIKTNYPDIDYTTLTADNFVVEAQSWDSGTCYRICIWG